jgi:germination protein YpeB
MSEKKTDKVNSSEKPKEPVKAKKGTNTSKHTSGENKPAKRQTTAHSKQSTAKDERKLLKQQKKQERLRLREERKAALLLKRQEAKAAREERKAALKQESRQMRHERLLEERREKKQLRQERRKLKAEERQAKRQKALAIRQQKRAESKHAPGFGGWLAAVISLGVVTLAMGTVLTFGWLRMGTMQQSMAGTQTEALYELNAIVDNLDANLAKARVTTSTSDRVKVLSDIAIDSQMAEMVIERMPISMECTQQLSSFINKMSDSAQGMLYHTAQGDELTQSERASIEYMYSTNLKLKQALNYLTSHANMGDVMALIDGKGGMFYDKFGDINNNVIQTPKGIMDGPFADSVEDTNATLLQGLEDITPQRAEELARQYFAEYGVTKADCTGEAVARGMTCYNIDLEENGEQMFVQITKAGGKVIMFDSYKQCTQQNFSEERCEDIAKDFLSELGYDGLQAVWTSHNGTTCNINFVPTQDGALVYPDMIKVKVCKERGIVTGLEAISYVLNHGERNAVKATIDKQTAREAMSRDITVHSSHLAIIQVDGKELLTYEFFGDYDGSEYYIYVDANSGEEVEVFTIIGTAQGKSVM